MLKSKFTIGIIAFFIFWFGLLLWTVLGIYFRNLTVPIEKTSIIFTPKIISPQKYNQWRVGEKYDIQWRYPPPLVEEIKSGEVTGVVIRTDQYSGLAGGFIVKKVSEDASGTALLGFTSYKWKVGDVSCFEKLDDLPCKKGVHSLEFYKILPNLSYQIMVCKVKRQNPLLPYCGASDVFQIISSSTKPT